MVDVVGQVLMFGVIVYGRPLSGLTLLLEMQLEAAGNFDSVGSFTQLE